MCSVGKAKFSRWGIQVLDIQHNWDICEVVIVLIYLWAVSQYVISEQVCLTIDCGLGVVYLGFS